MFGPWFYQGIVDLDLGLPGFCPDSLPIPSSDSISLSLRPDALTVPLLFIGHPTH